MTGRTHLMGGLASLWALYLLPGDISGIDTIGTTGTSGTENGLWADIGLLALLAGFGSLLPDLDAPDSRLQRLSVRLCGTGVRPLRPAAVLLNRAFGHRGLLHSLAGWALLAALPGLLLVRHVGPAAAPAAAALALGYASHLLLDACTKTGVPLLWPARRRTRLLPARLRITTGSEAEEAFAAVLAGAAILLLVISLLRGSGGDTSSVEAAWTPQILARVASISRQYIT